MNCPKCGTLNNQGYKFCIKCGGNLSDIQNQDINQNVLRQEDTVINVNTNDILVQNESNFQTNTGSFGDFNSSIQSNNVESAKVSFMGYFFIILAVVLKPFTAFKEELNKFNGFKNSAILSLIISGIATLISLITSMFNTVMVKSFDWSSSSGYKTTWEWENLKDLDYVEIIGKNFLIYLGVIVAIAFVYYIVSLILKKQTNFFRLLGISSLSVCPILISALILSPLLSMIYTPLGMGITIVGAIYTIIILYEGMNKEIVIDGNMKIYFNLICLSILGIAAYYLLIQLFISSISTGLGDIINLFG